MDHFPSYDDEEILADNQNPAIMLYGRRFYKDQTPVEYLAEFLLVFVSQKGINKNNAFRFELDTGVGQAVYWPEDHIALKLFSFFPSSKLITRHAVHQNKYRSELENIKTRISGSIDEKTLSVRLLQSLFAGFVGVAKNRTWVTQSFLPASTSLLAREIDWLHSDAIKHPEIKDWDDSKKFFVTDRHNFMARGGELLFLQLAYLFSGVEHPTLSLLCSSPTYQHLTKIKLVDVRDNVQNGLRLILETSFSHLDRLANFIEDALSSCQLFENGKLASLGWIPVSTIPEAFLFAHEIDNICRTKLGALEKVDLLQLLCCMQVLRTFCFQSQRVGNGNSHTDGFSGNYAWIVSDPGAQTGSGLRKLAQSSFEHVEDLLYRVLRQVANSSAQNSPSFAEADKHGFQIFRKIGKEIGLIIPRTGGGQRFVLSPQLLRFLVAALVAPGERVRLTVFYARVFAHYGIALGDRQLAIALRWIGNESESRDYAVAADTAWVEEALKQGGFLVELSDAVSIVHNPDDGVAVQG